MPSVFSSSSLALDSRLLTLDFLVCFAEQSRRGCVVIAASAEAERLGIHPGQPLAEAQALAGGTRCQWVADDPAADRAALQALALRCQRFTPLAGIEEAPRPECLLLEIGGSADLFGGEAALIDQLQRAFRRYDARIGVADTLGAAWALAHTSSGSPGIAIPGSLKTNLDSLPISALRLSPETIATLAALGLHTIAQLAELPRSDLPSRFGEEVLRRLDQAFGARDEFFTPERLKEPICAEWNGEDPLCNQASLEYLFAQLWSTLEPQLARHQAGVRELRCEWLPGSPGNAFPGTLCAFREEKRPRESIPWTSEIRLAQPTRDLRRLQELFRLQCERLTWPEGITGLKLEVTWAESLNERQSALFDGSPNSQQSLSPLLERLSSRLGEDAVLWPEPQDDPQPEFAYQFIPVLGSPGTAFPGSFRAFREEKRPRESSPWASSRPWQLFPPQRIDVLSVVPDGPPQRWFQQGKTRDFIRVWGPERIETGWWRGPDVKRDYYRVELDDGTHWWLFRDRDSGAWFIHGAFG